MPDSPSHSIVSLGDIAKPADTLIKKISNAVGGVFGPFQIKRIAKAEAEAAIIKAHTEIQITDLHRRAMHRFIEEEAYRQQNMEHIAAKALPQLEANSDPDKMEDDWVSNFFDKSRIVSDTEMQDLWARVLAGEANAPGTYSKRTVNFLGDLDKKDAELFQALCSFGWVIGKFTPLVFDPNGPLYGSRGLNFGTLTHLDSIGLVQFHSLVGFKRTSLPKTFAVTYCGEPLVLSLPKDHDNELQIGKVLLTKVGEELATVCQVPGVEGFLAYVKEKWKAHLAEGSEA
jgi:uncharacterized protein DUF2806